MIGSTDPLVVATWLLVIVTGVYAALTYRLTSTATRQVEAANLPYLTPTLGRSESDTTFQLVNRGPIPGYDVDVLLVALYSDDDDTRFEEFTSRFVADRVEVSASPDAAGLYGVRDRIVYPLAPGMMGVEALTAFPLPPGIAMLMLQFRGPLGVNYSQLYRFSWDEASGVYRVDGLDPPQPKKCVRVDAPELKTPFGRRLPSHFIGRPHAFSVVYQVHSIAAGQLAKPAFADERGSWFPLRT